jgi:hypothetical protein
MAIEAEEIVRRAWRELPQEDRDLLREIGADRWQVCDRALGTYMDELLRSAGHGSFPAAELAGFNAALGLWVPGLQVVLINESHPTLDGLDDPSLDHRLSHVAWHEWGHALSFGRIEEEDIAAGPRYVGLLPKGFVRYESYSRREYTREVVADIYAMLMTRRRKGKTGRPPWLHPEVYELMRRAVGWNHRKCGTNTSCPRV